MPLVLVLIGQFWFSFGSDWSVLVQVSTVYVVEQSKVGWGSQKRRTKDGIEESRTVRLYMAKKRTLRKHTRYCSAGKITMVML